MDDNQNENVFKLSKQDSDIIGEVSNISMGSAATALSNIMGKKVIITSPHVEIGSEETIDKIERIPSIGVIISYTEGVVGKDILIIKKSDAAEIVKTLMGDDSPDEEFGEIQISAIAEVMNQMMGSAATALSNFIGRTVNISPPSAFMLTEENRMEKLNFIYENANSMVLVRFLFKVEDLIESDLYMIMSREFSSELVAAMMKNFDDGSGNAEEANAEEANAEEANAAQQAAPQPPVQDAPINPAPQYAPPEPQYAQPAPQYAPPAPQYAPPAPQYAQPAPQYAPPAPQYAPPAPPQYAPPAPQYYAPAAAQASAAAMPQADQTRVRPVKLSSFDSQVSPNANDNSNFELIQDVPLELSVEVGKAYKMVKEVIDLTVGSIIELDKQAGDPVDIMVNGQLIAHGEVVVIDESFGVRLTEIVDPKNKGK
jgi:flagellar motor switch protein FliN/FliY